MSEHENVLKNVPPELRAQLEAICDHPEVVDHMKQAYDGFVQVAASIFEGCKVPGLAKAIVMATLAKVTAGVLTYQTRRDLDWCLQGVKLHTEEVEGLVKQICLDHPLPTIAERDDA